MSPKPTLFALSLSLGCATLPPAPDRTLRYGAQAYRLEYDNGLQLVVAPDDTADLVEVDLRLTAGSRDEPAGKSGLAHLVEHVALELAPSGTPLSKVLADFSLGYNAFTSPDNTHFQILTLPSDVERAFHVYAELLASDCGTLSVDLLERERAVVRNELFFRDAAFQRDERDALAAAVYPQEHPYGRSVGGTTTSIAALSREDVCNFLASYYDPAKAAVIVTGAVDLEQVRGFADAALELVPSRSPAPRAVVPPLRGSVRRDASAPLSNHGLALAFPTPPRFSSDDVAFRLLARVTEATVALLPWTSKVVKKARVVQVGGNEAPALVVLAEYHDPAHKALVEKELWHAIEQIGDVASFVLIEQRQRQELRRDIISSLEALTTRAFVYGEYLAAPRQDGLFHGDITRIDGLDSEAIRAFAKLLFRHSDAVTIDIAPSPGQAAPPTSEAQVRLPRDVHGEGVGSWDLQTLLQRRTRAATVQVHHLANGLRVLLAPTSAMPILDARLIVHAGYDDAPAESPLAPLLVAQLAETPQMVSALRATELFQLAGGSISAEVDERSTVFAARGLSIYLDHILGGLASHVREGVYTRDTLTAFRAVFDATSEKLSPTERARHQLIRTLVGPQRRCLDLVERGALASEKYNPAQLRRFRLEHYRAQNATLLLTGKFDTAVALAHVEAVFGTAGDRRWNTSAAQTTHHPKSAPSFNRQGPHVATVAQERSQQAYLSLGLVMPRTLAEDVAQTAIVRKLVDFEVQMVRTRLGSSYTLGVEVQRLCDIDMLWIVGDIEAGRAAEVTELLRQSLAALRAGDNFTLRFDRARHAAARELVAEANDSLALATRLQLGATHSNANDSQKTPEQQVADASPERVRQALVETLDPALALALCTGQTAAAEQTCAGLRRRW